MAAGILNKPGTDFGPCEGDCKHLDCAETRKVAKELCDICKEPIGYDKRFFQKNNWEIFTHEICELKKIEKEVN